MSDSDLFGAAAEAVYVNAQRNGLTWRLTPGTVLSGDFGLTSIPVQLDGDENSITAQSLIGPLPIDARVMIMTVPPQGNYIVGVYALNGATSQAGKQSMSVVAATSATQAVTFNTPFETAPAVATNINHGTGASSGWQSRAFNISTTGFTLFIFGSSSTFTADVYWQAQPLTQ